MGAEFLGGVFLKRAVVVLLAFLTLSGCGKKAESEAEKIDILSIDGINVPFEKGEQAVSDALGSKYIKCINFENADKIKNDELVLVLCDKGDTGNDMEYLTYSIYWMLDEKDNSHDIKMLDGLDLYSDIETLKKNFGEYLIEGAGNSYSDYTIFLADGVPVKPVEKDNADDTYLETMAELRTEIKNGDIADYVQVSFYKSDDGKAEDHIFQVIRKK